MSRSHRINYENAREAVYGQLPRREDKAENHRLFIGNEDLDKKLIKFYSQASASPILGEEAFINTLTLAQPSKEIPRKARLIKRPSILDII